MSVVFLAGSVRLTENASFITFQENCFAFTAAYKVRVHPEVFLADRAAVYQDSPHE